MVKTRFTKWLGIELQARGWKAADLAGKAGISRSILSLYIKGEREPGDEVCIKIAKAFSINPVDVMIEAGILDEKDKDREILRPFDRVIISIIKNLVTKDEQAGFIEIAKAYTNIATSKKSK